MAHIHAALHKITDIGFEAFGTNMGYSSSVTTVDLQCKYEWLVCLQCKYRWLGLACLCFDVHIRVLIHPVRVGCG